MHNLPSWSSLIEIRYCGVKTLFNHEFNRLKPNFLRHLQHVINYIFPWHMETISKCMFFLQFRNVLELAHDWLLNRLVPSPSRPPSLQFKMTRAWLAAQPSCTIAIATTQFTVYNDSRKISYSGVWYHRHRDHLCACTYISLQCRRRPPTVISLEYD